MACAREGCVLEAEAGRSRVIQMLVDQEFIAQEGEAQRSHKRGRKGVRLLRNEILRALILAHGEARNVCSSGGKWIGLATLAEAIAEIHLIMLREVLIEANTELILIRRQSLRADKGEWTGIGAWIKRQQILGEGIDERELIEWQWLRRRIWRDKEIEELAAGLADLTGGIVDAVARGVERPIVQRT